MDVLLRRKVYPTRKGGATVYKIGEFSKIIGITTKALRYYDAEGILSPSCRSPENGYPFYAETDLKKAEMILEMRKFNFTISEMKDALRNIQNEDDFMDYLQEKVAITQALIARHSRLISEIQAYLKEHTATDGEGTPMNDQVWETEIPAMKFASIRFRGQYHEIPAYFELLYKSAQNKITGSPFTCYHALDYSETSDLEVCVPVSEKIIAKNISNKAWPPTRAIHVTHVGNYENLKFAYKALFDYANAQGLSYATPWVEIYEKGYGTAMAGNPEKYITQIYLPIKT